MKFFHLIGLSLFLFLFLTGCSGGGGGQAAAPADVPSKEVVQEETPTQNDDQQMGADGRSETDPVDGSTDDVVGILPLPEDGNTFVPIGDIGRTYVGLPKNQYLVDGILHKLEDGYLYKQSGGDWKEIEDYLQDYARSVTFTKGSNGWVGTDSRDGTQYQFSQRYQDGFESYDEFHDMFDSGNWNTINIMSPAAPKVEDYVALRKKIFARESDFIDNRISIEKEITHSGDRAVRFHSKAPLPSMDTAKSLIQKSDLIFFEGDEIWFSGWFYIEKGVPSTFFDFEDSFMKEQAGIRLFIREEKYVGAELKFASKPSFRQRDVQIPVGQWVHIVYRSKLSSADDGRVTIWQDGKRIIDLNGKTLPWDGSAYNSFQLGITATGVESDLIVDDIMVDTQPIQGIALE